MRVLIVDDTIAVRERLASFIAEIPGLHVIGFAADGVEALSMVAACSPDIVVLDLEMPQRNGFHVLAALRFDAPHVVSIVVSNHGAYRAHALEAGAAHFFDKGNELDGLIATLVNLGGSAAGARR